MTCGSHEPAPYSTFQRRHEIERKREVTKYQEQKIIQEKKLLLYIEDDIWVPLIQALSLQDLASWLYIEDDMRAPCVSSLLNVSKAAGDQKKKKVARN